MKRPRCLLVPVFVALIACAPRSGRAQSDTAAGAALTLVAVRDGVTRVHDRLTGAPVSPELEVRLADLELSSVFAPDGRSVVVIDTASRALVFDTHSGKRIATIVLPEPRPEDEASSAAARFTADGTSCFIMDGAGVLRRYQTKDWESVGEPMKLPPGGGGSGFTLSSDGTLVVMTTDTAHDCHFVGSLQLWDAATCSPLGPVLSATDGIRGRFFHGDRHLLLTRGSGEPTVHALPSMDRVFSLPSHDDVGGTSVVVTEDEKLLVSWGNDGQITSHDAWTGRREGLIDMGARVQQLLLTPNPRQCFLVLDNTLGDQADAYLLKASLPELAIQAIARLDASPGTVTLASDGLHVMLQGAGVRIFSSVDLAELAGSASSSPAPDPPVEKGWHALRGVLRADLAGDGCTLITQVRDGSLAVWDVDSGLRAPLPGSSYAMSPDGNLLLVRREDGSVRVHEAKTGAPLSQILDVRSTGSPEPRVEFAPDARSVVLLDDDRGVVVFATHGGPPLRIIPTDRSRPGQGAMATARYTSDGLSCFVLDPDGSLQRFETAGWTPVGAPMRHPGSTPARLGLDVSTEGALAVTFDAPDGGASRGSLQLWDAARSLPMGGALTAAGGIAGRFVDSNRRLVVTRGRGVATLHELPAMTRISCMPQPTGRPCGADTSPGSSVDETWSTSIAMSSDQRHVIAFGYESQPGWSEIRFHDASTGERGASAGVWSTVRQILPLPSGECLVLVDNSAFPRQGHYDFHLMKLTVARVGHRAVATLAVAMRVQEPIRRVALSPDGRRLLIQQGRVGEERVRVLEAAGLREFVQEPQAP